jgi:CMP-N-acetylneuraminic acid synthetase
VTVPDQKAMDCLALIPARGGSKGIPRKNVRVFSGRPLIEWTIDAARKSDVPARVVVSTEDPEIAAISRRAGAEVPFTRPARLALDESTAIDVVLSALDWFEEHERWIPETVLLLQPTSPLRSADDLRGAAQRLVASGADAVVSVQRAQENPFWMKTTDDAGRLHNLLEAPSLRRQDLPSVYLLNGAIYLTKTAALRQHRSFSPPDTVAYVMPIERSVDIDTEADWQCAESLAASLSE